MPHILVVGSPAYDDVQTPVESRRDLLGGAATYFALAARLYGSVSIVGVVGDDFRDDDLALLRDKAIDVSGVGRARGRSFRWRGRYDEGLRTAETVNTEIGVVRDWRPMIDARSAASDAAFLANSLPEIQRTALTQIAGVPLVGIDTMIEWIERRRPAVLSVFAAAAVAFVNEAEAAALFPGDPLASARRIRELGPRAVVLKRGDRGAVLITATDERRVGAFPVPVVRDPTGAGDAFAGGFLGHLAEAGSSGDDTLARALVHGAACASFAIEEFGVAGLADAEREWVDERVRRLGKLAPA